MTKAIAIEVNTTESLTPIPIDDNDDFSLHVTTLKDYHQLFLTISDSREVLEQVDSRHHTLDSNKLRRLIRTTNYMGVVNCTLSDFASMGIIHSFQLEITSSKIDRPELKMMLNTILNSQYSHNIIDERSIVQFAIHQINDSISLWYNLSDLKQFLLDVKELFSKKSLKYTLDKQEYQGRMQPSSKFTHRTLTHLLKDSSKLHPTTEYSRNTIQIEDELYAVDRITTEKMVKKYDTYENMIILSFLYGVFKDIKESMETIRQVLSNQPSEKMTLINLVNSIILPKHLANLTEIHQSLIEVLQVIKQKYPLLKTTHKRLQITPLFQGDKTYKKLFQYMITYGKNKNKSPKEDPLCVPLNSIDKLFEYYCLCCLLEGFFQAGYAITELKKDVFSIIKNRHHMRLYFCPYIYHQGENSPPTIDGLYMIPNLASNHKIPDYVLEIHNSKGLYFWWFDAKYTQQTNSYNKLTSIGYSYLNEISTIQSGHSQVIGGSIFTPKQQKKSNSLQLYSFPTVFPILSSYAFDISQPPKQNTEALIKHITNSITP